MNLNLHNAMLYVICLSSLFVSCSWIFVHTESSLCLFHLHIHTSLLLYPHCLFKFFFFVISSTFPFIHSLFPSFRLSFVVYRYVWLNCVLFSLFISFFFRPYFFYTSFHSFSLSILSFIFHSVEIFLVCTVSLCPAKDY